MKIAIYSRKSKLTEKGESIENQIQLCTDYINLHYSDTEVKVYEDEGFSGKDTDRPMFKQLMKDAKDKKFNILMCYRLDRVSRNIADFANLIDSLQSYDIGFISLKEQFDTTSPMGRAMMYISGVFAQLERETIAERIKDNMLQLAKTGRWLGGITPTGFASEEICYTDGDKNRKLYKLIPIEHELSLVHLIFDKFIEFKSLVKLETYLIQNDIKTKNGKNFCIAALKLILTNPVYSAGDFVSYEYLSKNGCSIYGNKSDFNGLKGLMPYNRTKQSKKTSVHQNPCSEWIISLGEHQPVVSGQTWVTVQSIIDRNKDKTFRKVRSQEALLSGIIRCEACGSYMRPKSSRMSADGTKMHYYYMCELKEKSKRTKCNTKNVSGHTIDTVVLDFIKNIANTKDVLWEVIRNDKEKLSSDESYLNDRVYQYKNTIATHKNSINNLLNNLSLSTNDIASKYILDQIEKLGMEIQELECKLNNLEDSKKEASSKNFNLELMQQALLKFSSSIDIASVSEKRDLIRMIVESVYWDGENLKVNIFGGNALKKL